MSMRGAGPFYEEQAPSPEYVRDDQYRKMTGQGGWADPSLKLQDAALKGGIAILFADVHPKLRLTEEEHLTVIKQSLLEVFPDDRENSWGSFRGYGTWGIDKDLMKEMQEKCIENIQKALNVKREKWGEMIGQMLKPYVNHYVWSIPNGMVYRKAQREFSENASNQ